MPETRAPLPSVLCSLGPRPHIVTGYLRQWFIDHFSVRNRIENPQLFTKLWSAVPTDTEIEIESVTRWKPQTTEFRPAVIVARNDWKVLRFGINDMMMGDKWVLNPGIDYFAVAAEGSHTLFCVSSDPLEAELIGTEVYRETLEFGHRARADMALQRFQTLGLGKVFEIEEARQNYAVPVTVAYAAMEYWRVVPYTPFLKRIVLSEFLP